RLGARCLIQRHSLQKPDDPSFQKALKTANPRLARKIREWLELPKYDDTPTHNPEYSSKTAGGPPFPWGDEIPPWVQSDGLAEQLRTIFARGELQECVRDLKTQMEPGRADLLYKKAIRIGILVAWEDIDRAEAEEALYQACEYNGLVAKNGENDI